MNRDNQASMSRGQEKTANFKGIKIEKELSKQGL
tara:strand:- start:251 stop:352 length:102 start_codon:yes stop_codon:yes gene_type:complete